MGEWKLTYTDEAYDNLEKIDRPERRQIIEKLEWFAEHFDELIPDPLHGDWRGFYKFRVGNWRIVYNFESAKQLVRVRQIDWRDRVYKKRR